MQVYYTGPALQPWGANPAPIVKPSRAALKTTICAVFQKFIQGPIKWQERWGGLGK